MVYWYTSPKPVESGAKTGITPIGMREAASIKRSKTNCLAK